MNYKELFKEIEKDHLSGASLLSRKTARAFEIYAQVVDAKTQSEYLKKLLRLSKDLISHHLFITPIFNLCNLILSSLEQKKSDLTVAALRRLTEKLAKDFYKNSSSAEEKIGENGLTLIKEESKVITNSFSSSVLSILKKSKGEKLKVIVLESRPLCEGRGLAEKLGDMKIDVTLIVDSAMGIFVKDVDMVLVGADCVTEKFFVNKTGTYPLALLARNKKIPLYVAAEKSKFIPERYRVKSIHRGEAFEVYEKRLKNVKVENPYFEEVPLSLCERIVTEGGLLTTGEVGNLIKKIEVNRDLHKEFAQLFLSKT